MVNVDGNEVRLTRREAELLELLPEGLTYKEMGKKLGISWQTVRFLLHCLYTKLKVGNGPNARMRAVVVAHNATDKQVTNRKSIGTFEVRFAGNGNDAGNVYEVICPKCRETVEVGEFSWHDPVCSCGYYWRVEMSAKGEIV